MSIQSKMITRVSRELEYPKLMISTCESFIVMMTDDSLGFVVCSEDGRNEVGYGSDSWKEGAFKPFTGEITLKNKEQ